MMEDIRNADNSFTSGADNRKNLIQRGTEVSNMSNRVSLGLQPQAPRKDSTQAGYNQQTAS